LVLFIDGLVMDQPGVVEVDDYRPGPRHSGLGRMPTSVQIRKLFLHSFLKGKCLFVFANMTNLAKSDDVPFAIPVCPLPYYGNADHGRKRSDVRTELRSGRGSGRSMFLEVEVGQGGLTKVDPKT